MYLVLLQAIKFNSCAYRLEPKPNNSETYDAVFAYEKFYGAAESDFFVLTHRKRKSDCYNGRRKDCRACLQCITQLLGCQCRREQ
jgi:hypothetical protein